MDRFMIDRAAIPAADDYQVIRIREALRDRQAAGERSPAGSRAKVAADHGQAMLQAGAL